MTPKPVVSVVSGGPAPLIVTALMGAADFAWADGLRRAHFPAERNLVPAHISLFHHLPPARLADLSSLLRKLAAEMAPAATLVRPISLGRGVAFLVHSPDLLAMRDQVADAFAYDLIPQDRATPRLHITIQNKVEPAAARSLLLAQEHGFAARPLAIMGLAIWHYRGGPWQLAQSFRFRGCKR